MKAFNDFRCVRCGRRYGWFGRISENPGCDRCPWKPDAEMIRKSEDLERRLAEAEEKILAESALRSPDRGVSLRHARLAAGFTLLEPARHLNIPVSQLSRWERGDDTIPEDVEKKLLDYYTHRGQNNGAADHEH